MIREGLSADDLASFGADAIVVGAGPVGLLTALRLETRGFRVLLVEAGGAADDSSVQALSVAEIVHPDNHHAAETTVARRLGGTSNLWGGRCVPFDPIDFKTRPWMAATGWPIVPEDLAPYAQAACQMLGAGDAVFSEPAAALARLGGAFTVDRLERWSNKPRIHRLHSERLRRSGTLLIALRTTVLGFDWDAFWQGNERIIALTVALADATRARVPAGGPVILCAGGNESTRLLLAEQRRAPMRFGGVDGPLGRFYQGHLNGQIADIRLAARDMEAALDFHVDGHGTYVRRRIAASEGLQRALELPNVVFWPVVPEVAQAEHKSGPLSLAFLALSFPAVGRRLIAEPIRLKHLGRRPWRRLPHVLNIVRDPFATLGFAPRFLWSRYIARPRHPGFFLRNKASRYGLEFHAEQRPDPGNRLTLGSANDDLGLPRLRIEYRFTDEDAEGVVRAHGALKDWLARARLGDLVYRVPLKFRAAAVLDEAKHGNHQIGTIRMAATAARGVVDRNCRAFGCENFYVVSTAVLPSSGQANPTLMAAQLGLRLADHIATAHIGTAEKAASTKGR